MTAARRIFLCRLGCIALCLVPTTLVGGWTCWRALGGLAVAERADWEYALAQRSGLSVQIAAVSYPAPGLARLQNVRLHEPETRQLIASATMVEVTAAHGGWHVELWQPRIETGGLAELSRLVHERLLRGGPSPVASCVIAARELTIARPEAVQTLLQCSLRYTSRPDGSVIECEFRLPESAAGAAPISLAASRNRQTTPPATQWRLDTAGQSLPCEWLAEAHSGVRQLGSQCRFAGTVSLVKSADRWTGTAAGRLVSLDLDALVTERFGHQWSGQATLDIDRLAIEDGRLTSCSGALRAGRGAISPSLLTAAAEHLQLVSPIPPSAETDQVLSFLQLALRFQLTGHSLRLAGEADPTQQGVVIAAAGGPLLAAPPEHVTAAVNLLRTLLPDRELQVPAARQTGELLRLFSLPEAEVRAAHTPTRLLPPPATSEQPAVRQPKIR